MHFAIAYKAAKDKKDACVWMLQPYRFNKINHRVDQIYIFPKDLAPYLPELWKGKRLPDTPIAIQPVLKSRRITVQKGCFTLHGGLPTALENMKSAKTCLEKIVIPAAAVKNIKTELMICGITESSLFPDLTGLSRELKAYYRPMGE